MTDCSYCKYRINEDDNTQQKCNKWMNKFYKTLKQKKKKNEDNILLN